jgi:hypothetical protein
MASVSVIKNTYRRSGVEFNPGDRNFVARMPRILYLPLEHEIRPTITVDESNPLELSFLDLAFGPGGAKKFVHASSYKYHTAIQQANQRLNKLLEPVMPYSMGMHLDFGVDPRDPQIFVLSYQDKHGGNTPFHIRGAGVRKITTLMVELSKLDLASDQVIILYDEPENSLHADAQHLLRTALEKLGEKPNIQVIYATHSPSMINPLKCRSLRLLSRKTVNGKATSDIDNSPYSGNYLLVRSSLGISPIDSLLYAPISVIVEGKTEVLCLNYLLPKLCENKIEGFDEADVLLSLMHFVDGAGDSFDVHYAVAKSQNSKPIFFVDGDKRKRVAQVEKKLGDPPIVALGPGQEFENLVPEEKYLEALSQVTGKELPLAAFRDWCAKTKLPPQMMFTKRVERWLDEDYEDVILDKARVMQKALEITPLEDVNLEPLRQLVDIAMDLLKQI